VDNDGDGLVDCADPGCQAGFTCVDADPPGWKGHFYVTETALPAGAAPPCPTDLTPDTDFESPAGPAQCSACSCSAAQGASCAPPQISCSSNSFNCGGSPQDWTPALQDGACHKPTNLLGNAIFLSCQLKSGTTLTSPGQCTPSTVDFPNKSPWQKRVDACGTDKAGGGCGGGKVCVPRGAGTPNESLCVRHDGTMPCPSGFTKTIQAYASASDDRACTDCTCGGANTTCSDGSYTFFDLDNCATGGAGTSNPVTIGGNCTDVSALLDTGSWSARATLPKASGTCPAGGGVPTGSVQPSQPLTYCCK